MLKARLKKERFIVVTENHGGYKAGCCIVCKKCGWLDSLKHEVWCPIAKGSLTHVQIIESE